MLFIHGRARAQPMSKEVTNVKSHWLQTCAVIENGKRIQAIAWPKCISVLRIYQLCLHCMSWLLFLPHVKGQVKLFFLWRWPTGFVYSAFLCYSSTCSKTHLFLFSAFIPILAIAKNAHTVKFTLWFVPVLLHSVCKYGCTITALSNIQAG